MPGKYFPKWRTILRWVFVLLVIGLAAQAGRLLHSQIKARAIRVHGPIPYTVTVREIIHAPDGTTRVSEEITEAVRADGSFVGRFSTSKGQSGRARYFSSGLQVSTNDVANTKTSMMKADLTSDSWLRDPNSKCLNSLGGKPMTAGETFQGEETIAGYRTAKIASDIITTWYALDYGCALVKDRWDFGPTEFTEKELVALVGEIGRA